MTTPEPGKTFELVRIGLLSISDRASSGVYEDKGIPALQAWLAHALFNPVEWETRLIPDDQFTISAALCQLVDVAKCDLVLTTAILSRQTAVIRGKSLIINLPGQPRAIAETLEGLRSEPPVPGIFAAVPYCIDLIGGPYLVTDDTVCEAFRPASARRT